MISVIVAMVIFLFIVAMAGLFIGMMEDDALSEIEQKSELQSRVTQNWVDWSLSRMDLKHDLYINRSSIANLWFKVNYPLAKEIHDGRQHEGDVGKDRSTSGQ